jgi:hypothetical protein
MPRIDKFGLLVAMVIASASVVSIARAQQSIQKALPDSSAEVEKILPGGVRKGSEGFHQGWGVSFT